MRSYRSMDAGPFGVMGMTPGVKALLLANVAIYIVQTLMRDTINGIGPITGMFGFIPYEAFFHGQVWRFVTYMFLHGGLTHILFNMIGLWMFGTQIESHWGRGPFLLYYLVCGLGGAFTYGLFKIFGMEAAIPMVGASGAVYGILLAYGMMFPDAVILVAMILPMKAKYAVVLFGLIELLSSISGSSSGVAHVAHLGGMGAGFVFLKMMIPSLRAGTGLRNPWRQWRGKRRLKVVRPEARAGGFGGNGSSQRPAGGPSPSYDRGPSDRAQADRTQSERAQSDRAQSDRAQVDAILDKISRDGLHSLTPQEQEILRRAGRR